MHLAVVPLRAPVDQRLLDVHAYPVDVPAGLDVIEGVEDNVKFLEERCAEVLGYDVAKVRDDAHVGAHRLGRLGRHGCLRGVCCQRGAPRRALQ